MAPHPEGPFFLYPQACEVARREVGSLLSDSRKQPENQGKDHTQQDRGSKRKVNRGMPAAPCEIAGQATEGKAGFAEEQEQGAASYEEQTNTDEDPAEVIHLTSLVSPFCIELNSSLR